jgi:hypothetical protein
MQWLHTSGRSSDMIEKPKATKRLAVDPMKLFDTIIIHCADAEVTEWVRENVKGMGSLYEYNKTKFRLDPSAVYDRKAIIRWLESYNDEPPPIYSTIKVAGVEYKLTPVHSVE